MTPSANMQEILNEKIYSRFGIQINGNTIQDGFRKFLKNSLLKNLDLLINPDGYKDSTKLDILAHKILNNACRQLFLDYDDYDSEYGFYHFLKIEFYDRHPTFEELLLKIQILLNILYSEKFISFEFERLISDVEGYICDYPILGIKIKVYKTKSPQVYPSISKIIDQSIENVLGILEEEKYKNVFENFDSGLKCLLKSTSKPELKDVVEDMVASCDEMAKIIFKDQNKGFKHVFEKDQYERFGLTNKLIKEIFRNLRDWMDCVKHGTIKNFSRDDVETIVNMTALFLRYSANKK
jgi:hypothetical protein